MTCFYSMNLIIRTVNFGSSLQHSLSADVLVCLVIPIRVLDYEGVIWWYKITCFSYVFLRFMPIFVSINTMVLITIERYLLFVKPHSFRIFTKQKNVLLQLAGVWSFSGCQCVFITLKTTVSDFYFISSS